MKAPMENKNQDSRNGIRWEKASNLLYLMKATHNSFKFRSVLGNKVKK